MRIKRAHKVWAIACAGALVLGLAGLLGASGCGDKAETDLYTATTAWSVNAGMSAGATDAGVAADESASLAPAADSREANSPSAAGSKTVTDAGTDQKVIVEAVLGLEVGKGTFQTQFDKAQQLAGLFGGYVLSSNSYASGEEDILESGSVAISVPAASFDKVMAEAKKLGEVKAENRNSQNVTTEYVDLKARVTNQQAYVNTMLALLGKAKTIEEILQVQQTLTYAQQELEQLKGQLQYLEAHTSYSTLTMNIYESGAKAPAPGEWGFVQALKDAVHNVVDAFSAVVRGLGWLVPIVIILAIVAVVAYFIVRAAVKSGRRGKASDQQDKVDKTS